MTVHTALSDVAAIYHNLDCVIFDRELPPEYGIDLFFDTQDVYRALIGLFAYFRNGQASPPLPQEVDTTEFEHPAALVDSLLAKGWLGPFRMLAPHQAEFQRLLENDAVFQERKKVDPWVDPFLKAVGVAIGRQHDTRALAQMNADESVEFVEAQASEADRYFKAFHAIQFNWWQRLLQWLHGSEPIFETSVIEVRYQDLIHSRDFADTYEYFRKTRREGGSLNNFNDAVALVTLKELAKRATVGRSQRIPRFFDTKGAFQRAASEIGILDQLMVRLPNMRQTPVLVSAEYLHYKAALDRDADAVSGDLVEMHKKLQEVTEGGKKSLAFQMLAQVPMQHDRGLGQMIEEFVSLSFLDRWLSGAAKDELKSLVHRLNAANDDFTSEEFRQRVEEVLRDLGKELSKDATSFANMSQKWARLYDGIVALRARFKDKVDKGTFQPIRDLELVRFSLPKRSQELIERILFTLLSSDIPNEEVIRKADWSTVVRLYLGPLNYARDAHVIGSVLWAVGDYKQIVTKLAPPKDKSEVFDDAVLAIYAAACLNSRRVAVAEEVRQRLIRELNAAHLRPWEHAERASTIAYLSFQLWRQHGNDAPWSRRGSRGAADRSHGADFIKEAIYYASAAAAALRSIDVEPDDDDRQMKVAYVTNQCLYYLVEEGREEELANMDEFYDRLVQFQGTEAWQFTFDDTVARYYYFNAWRSTGLAQKEKLVGKASERAAKAVEGGPENALVKEFLDFLDVQGTRLGTPAGSGRAVGAG